MLNEMSPRQRILGSLKGNEVDRMAWCPFLAYYWESLDKDIRQKGQIEYMQDIGADPLYRGSHLLAKPIFNKCNVIEKAKNDKKLTIYETPIGRLELVFTYSKSGDTWYLTGHPLKRKEDYKILQYIYENISFKEEIKLFEEDKKKLGEDGVYIPVVGTQQKSAFQCLLEHWAGTINLTYALFDFPEVVEECLATMHEKNMQTVDISLKSSADGFIFWEDTSTTNLNPQMFKKYVKPEIDSWGKVIQGQGKMLIHHACGHLNGVIDMIADENIDVLESISPPPTGDIELFDVRDRLPEHIAIIGGIEPVTFLNSPIDEFEVYVKEIIKRMKSTRYILANSDSCPPGVDERKFRLISRLVRES